MLLLDIRIIGAISGLEAAAKIRALGYAGPMIISSAYEPPTRQTLLALGADYIAKPWRIDALLERLLARRETTNFAPLNTYIPLHTPQPSTQPPEYETFTAPLKRNLEHVARLVIQSLEVQGVGMLVADSKDSTIQYFDVYPNRLMADDAFLALATGIMQEGKPVLLPNATPYLPNSAIRAFAGVPFQMKGIELSGSLCVYDVSVRSWTDTDLSLLYRALEVFSHLIKLSRSTIDLTKHNSDLNAYTDIIAHDLKTPLSAIINYVEMIQLLFGTKVPPEVNQYLGNISHAADIMKDMITHLLWIARLENPIESVSPVDMNEVVEGAMHRLDYAIKSRGVKINIGHDLPPAMGLDVWLEEIMANLISNAVKYMGDDNPAPVIDVRGTRSGRLVRYEVQDNGIGISADDREKLFRNFSRLNKIQVEGLGLGLAIVHRMITQLGGKIGIKSEVGRGSVFWFTLPAPPTKQRETKHG
jgi:signal transduction histidine kinase